MFTARYALSPYITQIRLVLKGLIENGMLKWIFWSTEKRMKKNHIIWNFTICNFTKYRRDVSVYKDERRAWHVSQIVKYETRTNFNWKFRKEITTVGKRRKLEDKVLIDGKEEVWECRQYLTDSLRQGIWTGSSSLRFLGRTFTSRPTARRVP